MAVTYPDTPPAAPARARMSPRELRARLSPPFLESRLWGWLGPLAVTAFAAFLRFYHLGTPSGKIFDEIYYSHDAQSLLRYGVETGTVNTPESFGPPEYVVHPPLGKWMISFGEWIFGYNSFGWRFSAAVVGTASVLILARIVRRMTRSTLLGCVAGLLMSLDGLEFVQSRTSMLDIFLMFCVVVGFGCLILDRDQVRERLAAKAAAIGDAKDRHGFGPRIGMRWWLLACGVSVGAASACKWNGVYLLPAYALLAMFWTMGAKRAAGVDRPFLSTLARDVPGGLVTMVVVPFVTYVASWTGWFMSTAAHAYNRDWAVHHPGGPSFIPHWIRDPLRSLWNYHVQAYDFHVGLASYHPYRSNAWGWLFENRPVLYFAQYPKQSDPQNYGCHAASGCARMIYDLGTPAIWWVSIPVMLFMLYLVFRRDWRGSALLVPFLFSYLPWLHQFKRTMFFFYALPLLPFICAGIALTMGYLIGPKEASANRRMAGVIVAGSYLLVVIVLFFYFYPILTGQTLPTSDWQARMWFNSWGEAKGQ